MTDTPPSAKELRQKLEKLYVSDQAGGYVPLGDDAEIDTIVLLAQEYAAPSQKRASRLNDALIQAAEFVATQGCYPPGTDSVDGIRSYFLNEAVVGETTTLRKGEA